MHGASDEKKENIRILMKQNQNRKITQFFSKIVRLTF